MKQLFTLALAILCSITILAQPAKKQGDNISRHQAFINGILKAQAKYGTRKLTANKIESLVAQSTRDNSKDSLIDSVRVMFGNEDTSIYDYNAMVYPYNYPYNTSPLFNNCQGNFTSPRVSFKAYYHWTVDPNTLTYGFYQSEFRSLDFKKEILNDTALYADSSFIPNMTSVNTFNAVGINSSYSFTYNAGKSDSAYKQFFTYFGLNYTKDSIYEYSGGTWHLISKTFYTYDLSNNLVQIDNYANPTDTTFTKPLIEQFQYINTFDGSHRMLTSNAKQYDGTSLAPYVADTFAYVGANIFHTSWKEYQYDGINKYWAPMSYTTKHIGAIGLPDSVNIQTYDSLASQWVPFTKEAIKYDSLKNPDSLLAYQYHLNTFPASPNFTTVYYYNYITDPNAVNELNVEGENLKVFPNPGTGKFVVQPTGFSQQWSVEIYNVMGEKIFTHYPIPTTQYWVDLSGFPSGVYMFMVKDREGAISARKLVVKE